MAADDVILAVGATVSLVASTPATYDSTGFGALTFVEVGEVLDIGAFGGNAEVVEFTPVKSGTVNKRKGSINYGTMSLNIGHDVDDAGQVLLKAGFDGAARNTVHSFKIVYNDSEIAYFTGVVSSFEKSTGDANTVIAINVNIELTAEVVTA